VLLHVQPESVRLEYLQFLSFLRNERLEQLGVFSLVPGQFRLEVIQVCGLEPLVVRRLSPLQRLPFFCLTGGAKARVKIISVALNARTQGREALPKLTMLVSN
jgi:hypothetical protein